MVSSMKVNLSLNGSSLCYCSVIFFPYYFLCTIINKMHSMVKKNIEFEGLMAVTMKNAVLWDVTLCGSCKN
jgi:hypothetical protein